MTAAESIDILGVQVHALDQETMRTAVHDVIERGGKSLVLNVNCQCINLAYTRPWLRDFLNSADLVFCDGVGVLIGARLLGHRLPERIAFTDWDWGMGSQSQQQGHSVFLLGARPGVGERAAERMRASYPHLRIAGTHHGYFDKTRGCAENEAVVAEISAARPDILIVCFGMPLQEQWLKENWAAIDAHVALCGGAFLDYVAGDLRRPPGWMSKVSLEWLGRLLIEPRRLWRRYVIGNPIFLLRVLRQRLWDGRAAPSGE